MSVTKLAERLRVWRYVRDIGGKLFYQYKENWHCVYAHGFPEVVNRWQTPLPLDAFFCEGEPLPEEAALYKEYLVRLDGRLEKGEV